MRLSIERGEEMGATYNICLFEVERGEEGAAYTQHMYVLVYERIFTN